MKDAGTVDETWCLGDMVGDGPDPNAVVEEVREIKNLTCLMGNHDVAVIGKLPLEIDLIVIRRARKKKRAAARAQAGHEAVAEQQTRGDQGQRPPPVPQQQRHQQRERG